MSNILYSVQVEKSSLLKSVLCMECKVRYFLSYYMQLALKYILIYSLFVHVHVMQTHHVFSRVRENAKGKETVVTNKEGCCECL